ncbi:TPA: hypothetical protein ACOFDS_003263 [Stenotrophomonas maltophilia]
MKLEIENVADARRFVRNYKSFQGLSDDQKASAYAGAMKYVLRRSGLERPAGTKDDNSWQFKHCCRLAGAVTAHARWVVALEQLAFKGQLHSYKRFLVRIRAMFKVASVKAKTKVVRRTDIRPITKSAMIYNQLRKDLKAGEKDRDMTMMDQFYWNYTSQEFRDRDMGYWQCGSLETIWDDYECWVGYERECNDGRSPSWLEEIIWISDRFDHLVSDEFLEKRGARGRYVRSELRRLNSQRRPRFIKKVAPPLKKA